MFDDGIRRSNFDIAYPRTRKFVEELGRCGVDELLPLNVSGEVELIARSSYRLGNAEARVELAEFQMRKAERDNKELRESLQSACRDRDYNEELATRNEKEAEAIGVELGKLKKKYAPKKKVAKRKSSKKENK